MSYLTLEELAAYFFQAQPQSRPYSELDFVRLIEDLGLEETNRVRQQIVLQLAGGRRLQVIRAEIAA